MDQAMLLNEEHYYMPQKDVAKLLNMRPSSFSKKWNIAALGRRWPYRRLRNIEAQLLSLYQNVEAGFTTPEAVKLIEALLNERMRLIKPVVIM